MEINRMGNDSGRNRARDENVGIPKTPYKRISLSNYVIYVQYTKANVNKQ